MIALTGLLANSPAHADLVWDMECPRIKRHSLRPQCSLLRLDPHQDGREKVLFLPPISGHGSALIQDLAKPMVDHYDVYVLDWADPVKLQSADADYGHDAQVSATRAAIDRLSNEAPLHIVATCQAASPTLLALDGSDHPNLTLTLVAAPLVDGPGGVCDLFTDDKADRTLAAAESLTTRMMSSASVLPGATQLAAILRGAGGAMRILRSSVTTELFPIGGNRSENAKARRIALLDARNIPERLLIEGLTSNFIDRQHLDVDLDLSIAIHLVAGGADEVVPAAQTFGISEAFPDHKISCSLFSGLDHFDLFSSSTARIEVSEKLMAFFRTPTSAPEFSSH
jgi:hypothetical protein